MRLQASVLCLLALNANSAFGQHVEKSVLDHIRSVSVSIEWAGRCHGSGTLFDKDGETWCITANHVVDAARGKQLRVAQRFHDRKHVAVNAEIVRQCRKTDVAILKIGQGVFGPGAKFYNDCCQSNGKPPALDTPIVHCGSMNGLHHTISRGYLVGLDRDMKDQCLSVGPQHADQADLTAYYGSSGGGVFLADGRFIGMAYAGIPQRIVFFVPIRQIKLP